MTSEKRGSMVKKYLFSITPEKSIPAELAVTALRVFTGLSLAMAHGVGKIPPSEQFVAGVATLGFPAAVFFAWAAGLAEFFGGLLLAAGFFTRPAAFFIACTMIVAAFLQHAPDPFTVKERALLFLAIAIVFLVRGAGRWAVDRFFAPKRG